MPGKIRGRSYPPGGKHRGGVIAIEGIDGK
jgi:hypothetical protein